jgi:hypothetical protein
MPNWCENDLVIKGKPKDLNELVEFVKSSDENIFDFDKIIPMPEVLKGVMTGFITIDGKKYENWRKDDTGIEQEELDRWREEYGHDNWYSWSIENWGTKWNASEPFVATLCDDRITYTFNTAWSPPIPVIAALAEKFPKLKFSLKYYERGCAFKGYAKYAKGVVVEEGSGTYAGKRGG